MHYSTMVPSAYFRKEEHAVSKARNGTHFGIVFTFHYFSAELQTCSTLKFSIPEKATKVLTLLSNVKTLRTIAPNLCGLVRKAELYIENKKELANNDFNW